MPPTHGLYSQRRTQIAIEETPGTALAATKLLIGETTYDETEDREKEEYPNGVRMPVVGDDITVGRGGTFQFEGSLDTEQILYCGLLGLNSATPTDLEADGGNGPYSWAFELDTNHPSTKTATIESVISDGSSKHYERKMAYCALSQFELRFGMRTRAMMRMTGFGRRSATVTAATVSQITGRTPLASGLWAAYIDTTGAGLGGTQKTGTVRSATLTVPTGIAPDDTLDGRADLDFTQFRTERVVPTLSLVLEHNANAKTEVDAWRSKATRFIRLQYTNGLATAAQRTVTIDLAGRYVARPGIQRDGEMELVSGELEIVYDQTWTHALLMTVINGLSTLT